MSVFGFVIREKQQLFWEGPRLLAHPLFEFLSVHSVCKVFINEHFIRIYCFFHDGWIELVELQKIKSVSHLKMDFTKKCPEFYVYFSLYMKTMESAIFSCKIFLIWNIFSYATRRALFNHHEKNKIDSVKIFICEYLTCIINT